MSVLSLYHKTIASALTLLAFSACQASLRSSSSAASAPQAPPLHITSTANSRPSDLSANLLLGNPSNATPDPNNKNNFLMVEPYYTLSYNNSAGEPNWVSWQLTKQDLGDAPRRRTFAEDTTLPEGFTRITHRDYANSGFDRGHQCPHSDRAANRTMSYATFTMTNIVPQAPSLNQKAWNTLEDYLRGLVEKDHDHIYTICGPAGLGGWGSKGFQTTIAGGKVSVPAMCWKIAVIVPPGEGSDFARIDADTRVIAAIMPNDNSISFACAQYRTSVEQIEKVTGLHFFTALPPAVADVLKKKIDTAPIPAAHVVHQDSD